MIMNMYDYKLMEKLITVALVNNELETVKERLEARVWWDDGFKALFDMVLKDVKKKNDLDPFNFESMEFKDSKVVDEEAKKVQVNRYVRSCLRIVTDYMDRK